MLLAALVLATAAYLLTGSTATHHHPSNTHYKAHGSNNKCRQHIKALAMNSSVEDFLGHCHTQASNRLTVSNHHDNIGVNPGQLMRLYACSLNKSIEFYSRKSLGGEYSFNFSSEAFIGRANLLPEGSAGGHSHLSWPIDFDALDSQVLSLPQAVCFMGTIRLYRPGKYSIDVYREFREFKWLRQHSAPNMTESVQTGSKSVHLSPSPLMTRLPSKHVSHHNNSVFTSAGLTIEVAADNSYGNNATCEGIANTTGVWDRQQLMFHGDICSYRQDPGLLAWFRHLQHNPRNFSMLWGGDSNSRRVLKALTLDALGRQWCPEALDRKRILELNNFCFCEDNDKWPYLDGERPQPDGIQFSTLLGLSPLPNHGYDFRNVTRFLDRITDNMTVVVLGVGNWDAAFGQFEDYLVLLPQMVRYLKAKLDALNRRPLVVIRTPNYYCCNFGPPGRNMRSYTRKLVMLYRNVTIDVFNNLLPEVRFWDSYRLGESRPLGVIANSIDACLSAHMDARMVFADMNMLLNLIYSHIVHRVGKSSA